MKTTKSSSVLFLLFSPLTAMANQGRWYATEHMWGSGGWMWGSMFMWIVLITLVILGILAFSKLSPSSDTGYADQSIESTPLEILNTRYAKGEINQQEYETQKKALQS